MGAGVSCAGGFWVKKTHSIKRRGCAVEGLSFGLDIKLGLVYVVDTKDSMGLF